MGEAQCSLDFHFQMFIEVTNKEFDCLKFGDFRANLEKLLVFFDNQAFMST